MSVSIKSIWTLGLGGVGGYVGGRIAEALTKHPGRQHIYFIARGEHLRAIQQQGLRLMLHDNQPLIGHPALATDDMSQLPLPELVIVAVKSYDLQTALKPLVPYVRPGTIILPLLNGIDIVERCRRVLPEAIILPACIYVGVHKEGPGVIRQQGRENKIIFGPDPKHLDLNLTSLKTVLTRAHLNCDEHYNPWPAIWSKYLFIAPLGLVTSAYNKTLGEVANDPSLLHQVRLVMEETRALALAKDIVLPKDIVESTLKKLRDFPPETKTSYQRDVETPGKANEGELFGPTIIRLGQELNRATPMTEKLTALLGLA